MFYIQLLENLDEKQYLSPNQTFILSMYYVKFNLFHGNLHPNQF